MANVIRTRTARSDRWPLWVAGALAGVLASWLVLRPRAGEAPGGGAATQGAKPRARWSSGPRPRARSAPTPDLIAIEEGLRARSGTEGLQVRSLGGGILELVGSAPDDLDLPALLEALAAEAGVSVVVNRAWTSRSGTP
jgi:hypothetical protein